MFFLDLNLYLHTCEASLNYHGLDRSFHLISAGDTFNLFKVVFHRLCTNSKVSTT